MPVTVNDVLDSHVALDLQCLDRLYLHGYLAQLQVGGQVIRFLKHRGFPVPSLACLQQIGDAFRRRVASFAEANHIPVVPLKAADRNIEVMKPYLDRAAATGRSQVAAIGVAQEMQRVLIARQRATDPGKCPQFSFDKKDRQVTVYYFCDALQPGTINVFFQRWLSRTIVFTQPRHARAFFEALVTDNLDLGRPDTIEIVFGRRPACLGELQDAGRAINTRLLHTECAGQGCVLANPVFERIAHPTVDAAGRRAAAMRPLGRHVPVGGQHHRGGVQHRPVGHRAGVRARRRLRERDRPAARARRARQLGVPESELSIPSRRSSSAIRSPSRRSRSRPAASSARSTAISASLASATARMLNLN